TGKATFQADTSFPSQGCDAFPEAGGWWRVLLSGGFDPSYRKRVKTLGISLTPEPFKRAYEGDGHSHILIWDAGTDTPESRGLASVSARPSSEFANWRRQGAGVEGGIETPDGTTSGTKLTEDGALGTHGIAATVKIDASKPVSASLSARAGSGRRLLV